MNDAAMESAKLKLKLKRESERNSMVNRIILNETSCHGAGAVKGVAFLAQPVLAGVGCPGRPRGRALKGLGRIFRRRA